MRDALVAALTLDIFNRHGNRVKMANLAQTVNVLQAPILTEAHGERFVLTPTYHVFELYKMHQNATLLPLSVDSEPYTLEGQTLSALSGTASLGPKGNLQLTLSNVTPDRELELTLEVQGLIPKVANSQVLTAQTMDAHNSFASPQDVAPKPFENIKPDRDRLFITLPAMSLVALTFA